MGQQGQEQEQAGQSERYKQTIIDRFAACVRDPRARHLDVEIEAVDEPANGYRCPRPTGRYIFTVTMEGAEPPAR